MKELTLMVGNIKTQQIIFNYLHAILCNKLNNVRLIYTYS